MAGDFRAYRVEESADGTYHRSVTRLGMDELPAGEVLVRVHYSSLNYKDALSATGNKGVTRRYPHTPGIDAAGVVESSSSGDWRVGDEVLVTSYDLGMDTDGGLAEYIRVPAAWVVRCPAGLSLREAMIYGTAGFTAGLCLDALLSRGVTPEQGEVLVTGATGGVGSLAVAMLARLGFTVFAGTGKPDAVTWLESLGAAGTIGREDLVDASGRPMLKGRWAGVVDTVGGDILATALASMAYGGTATCCGLVASPKLNTTVLPFILRGVALIGADSGNTPMPRRQAIWSRLAGEWRPADLEAIATEVDLDGVDAVIERLLAGGVRGRTIVRIG